MKIIICGAGRVGYGIADRLSSDGHDVTLVDRNPDLIAQVMNDMDVGGVVGHAAYPDILKAAGADAAEMIIAVTYSDEVNMTTCQIAHTVFQIPTKIARIRAGAYLNSDIADIFAHDAVPVDFVISPENEVAKAILQHMAVPGAFYSARIGEEPVIALGVNITKSTPIISTAIGQLGDIFPDVNAMLIAIGRGERLFAPNSDDALMEGDRAYFVAAKDHVTRTMALLGKKESEALNICIVGGGNIGIHIAKALEANGQARTRVIERDAEQAEIAAEQLSKSLVLSGDGLSEKIMREAGVNQSDLVAVVTDDDRTNLLAASLATRLGAKSTYALVNDTSLAALHQDLNVSAVIDPRGVTVSRILLRLRKGRLRSLLSLERAKGEIITGKIMERSILLGKSATEDMSDDGMRIGAIIRDGVAVQLNTQERIEMNDIVTLFAERSAIAKVEQVFRVSQEFF